MKDSSFASDEVIEEDLVELVYYFAQRLERRKERSGSETENATRRRAKEERADLPITVGWDSVRGLELLDDLGKESLLEIGEVADGEKDSSVLKGFKEERRERKVRQAFLAGWRKRHEKEVRV